MSANRLLQIAFGMTHAGKSLLWAATDALTLFVLIKLLHIPPVMAGSLFVLSSFWNALVDGSWGHIVNRHAAIRAILPGLCGLAAGLACLSFAILPWLPAGAGAATAIALFLFRTSFSLLDVPHNASAAALANLHGHLVVARWRSILGALTAIIVAAAAMPMIGAATMAPHMARMMFLGIAILAGMLLVPLPWLIGVTRDATPLLNSARVDSARRAPIGGLALFCVGQMLGFAALASIGKAMLHTGPPGWLFDYSLLILTLVRLAAVGLWSPLATRIGSARALSLAYIGSAVAALMLPAAIGQGMGSAAMILGLLGLSLGGVILLAWSSFSEQLAGWGMAHDPAAPAGAYGWFTATSKIGLGLSGLITGAWLGQAGGGAIWSLWLLVVPVAMLCLGSAMVAWRGWRCAPRVSIRRLQPSI